MPMKAATVCCSVWARVTLGTHLIFTWAYSVLEFLFYLASTSIHSKCRASTSLIVSVAVFLQCVLEQSQIDSISPWNPYSLWYPWSFALLCQQTQQVQVRCQYVHLLLVFPFCNHLHWWRGHFAIFSLSNCPANCSIALGGLVEAASTLEEIPLSCPPEGVFGYPHPKACDEYFQCTNGTLTHEYCPNGLLFTAETGHVVGFCAYNWNVDCKDKTLRTFSMSFKLNGSNNVPK